MSSTSTKAPSGTGTGRLSVVATPIGNLDDVSIRCLATLRAADTILAEDTRRTKRLCTHHGVGTPLRAFHAHSGEEKVDRLVDELAGGAHLALVTDAGTPVVSDPGIRLVAAAREQGIAVEVIPGPSAVTAAISVAGLRADVFRFVGFLPRGGGRRRRVLEEIAAERGATVLFEAPNRVVGTLADLEAHLGAERPVAVCRELTKLHEEVRRGPLGEIRAAFDEGVRGEVTIVVAGTGADAGEADQTTDPEEVEAIARALIAEGLSTKDAARRLAEETSLSRKEAYSLVLRCAEGDST